MMLDDDTRLESANLTKTEYRYVNTIVTRTVADYDVNLFILQMKTSIADNICTIKDTRAALDSGVTFVYEYNDSVGDHIADVYIAIDNCP